jgi:hypothetical protein
MKLITETVWDCRCFTEEKEDSKKALYIEGPFLVGNTKNKNNRIYPWDVLEEKADKYIDMYVKAHRAFGELGHPEGPRINPERISHLITELKKDGTQYIGKARINEEGLGKIAHGIIDMGGVLGVSSRAVGSLKENSEGVNEVQNDLHIATAADIVIDPSAPGAFVNGIYEHKEWIYNNGSLMEQTIADIKHDVDAAFAMKKGREKALIESWNKFLTELSKASNL